MAPRRIGPALTDVTLRVDGDEIPAVSGEPIAVALTAAGRLVLGRSVKYHRPRGAFCYAGRCDGCLMRVDGAPSRMTCREPARDGARIETQNVLGSAELDLLAATDWFFPGGMNHHQMFTWSKAANRAMQSVARRIAGVGRLPDDVAPPAEPRRTECDVLVIGAGPSGLAAAAEAASAGLSVIVCDEEPRPGGHLAHTPGIVRLGEGDAPIDARAAAQQLADRALERGASIALRHAVVALFEEDERGERGALVALADSPEGLVRIATRRVIVAQGRHEGAWAFVGSDLPGVIGSDAACRLLAHRVLCGERVVIAGPTSAAAPGSARLRALGAALAEAGAEVLGPFELSEIERARGARAIDRCDVRTVEGLESIPCDALVIAPPTHAAFELAAQAGAAVQWRDDAYEVVASPVDGATQVDRVRVVGRASGVASVPAGIAQAIAAARAIARELGGAS